MEIYSLSGHNSQKPIAHNEGSPEREIHIAIQAYLKKTVRKISNRQPNLTSTRTRRTTTSKAQSGQDDENNQDQRRIKLHRN